MSKKYDTIEREGNLITASFLDPTGSRKTTVQFPGDVTANQLINALLENLGLPKTQGGNKIVYRLDFQSDDGYCGRLGSDEIISSKINNCQSGVFTLLPELTAG